LVAVRVVHGLDPQALNLPRSSLTIGNFDGVHRGHQQIIARVRERATAAEAPTVVLTFEPHPLTVLTPGRAPERLTPLAEKLARLEAAGADVAVVAESNRELLSLTPGQFVERVVAGLHPRFVVEGASFRFGRGRAGTPQTLRELGSEHGFEVAVVDAFCLPLTRVKRRADEADPPSDRAVSSSLIRQLLGEGRVEDAAICLGRPYVLIGQVVSGYGRGRDLGFPTANLEVEGQLIPADGVYAGFAQVVEVPAQASSFHSPASRLPAAVSIGTTPTFKNADGPGHPPPRQVEAHLLGAGPDLYGRWIRLEFGRWLRPQETFASPEVLAEQIARDVAAVREYSQPRP